ncbi:MAG: hypothetical protein KME19_05455 [Microcoleus vaginatus WJT46-NPBG5]|nr:hypothetical protein [Microcoleus vaginatus WJT46-NPBG5]
MPPALTEKIVTDATTGLKIKRGLTATRISEKSEVRGGKFVSRFCVSSGMGRLVA